MRNLTELRELMQDIARNGQAYTPAVFAQKMMQADAILLAYEDLGKRLVPLPTAVVEDADSCEIARIFKVHGQCVSAIRWNPQGGEAYWGSAAHSLAAAVGSAAEASGVAEADDITERILDAAIDDFESAVNPVVVHDAGRHRPIN